MNKLALLSASLAVTGLTFSALAEDKPPFTQPPPFETARDMTAQPTGAGAGDLARHHDQVRELLGDVVEDALTKDDWDDVLEAFTKADRERLASFKLSDEQRRTIDGRIEQIQRDWNTKYGSNFDLDSDKVFADGSFRVMPGDVAGDAQMATERRNVNGLGAQDAERQASNAAGDRLTILIPKASAKSDGRAHDRAADQDGDRVTQPGDRDTATASSGDVTLNLVREGDDWVIDLPDHVTGEQFYDHLLATLTRIGDNKDQWPEDASQAYRKVSHQIVEAFAGSGLSSGSSDHGRTGDAAGQATPNVGGDVNRPGQNNPGGDFGNRNTFGESGNNPNR